MTPFKSFRHKWDTEVQALLEEAIARCPREPSVSKSPSMFDKLFFWLLALRRSAGGVKILTDCLGPKELASLEEETRRHLAELSKTYSLTMREKIFLWFLILGAIGGLVAALVWRHTLYPGGVVR